MACGRNGGAGEGRKALAFIKEQQQQSDLRCPGIILGLGLRAHFHCCQQHSSQERPRKFRLHHCDHCRALTPYLGSVKL